MVVSMVFGLTQFSYDGSTIILDILFKFCGITNEEVQTVLVILWSVLMILFYGLCEETCVNNMFVLNVLSLVQ